MYLHITTSRLEVVLKLEDTALLFETDEPSFYGYKKFKLINSYGATKV